MENWYHKLHSNDAVQSRTVSKISEFLKKARFSIGPTLDCVVRMKLMIPIFHTEFDALKVSFNRLSEIPPCGDFGDFWWLLWLFSRQALVIFFSFCPFWTQHTLGKKMAYVSVWVVEVQY